MPARRRDLVLKMNARLNGDDLSDASLLFDYGSFLSDVTTGDGLIGFANFKCFHALHLFKAESEHSSVVLLHEIVTSSCCPSVLAQALLGLAVLLRY